jgi:plastocyanin
VHSRTRLLAIVLLGASVLAACGGDSQRRGADRATPTTATTSKATSTSAGGTATTMGDDMGGMKDKYTITAKNVAFTPDTVTIAAGHEVEIEFVNKDAAVPHNLHFMTPKEVKTDVETGKADGVEATAHLKVDQAGSYDFVCDVHPTMKGKLVVK